MGFFLSDCVLEPRSFARPELAENYDTSPRPPRIVLWYLGNLVHSIVHQMVELLHYFQQKVYFHGFLACVHRTGCCVTG